MCVYMVARLLCCLVVGVGGVVVLPVCCLCELTWQCSCCALVRPCVRVCSRVCCGELYVVCFSDVCVLPANLLGCRSGCVC